MLLWIHYAELENIGDKEGVVVISPEYLDEIIENMGKKKIVAAKMREEVKNGQYVTGKFLEQMKKYGYEEI
ncbi:hypothetical protein FACS1894187_21150 [Synergistales bacterium]|nr:hypothetical protein FACS1894187_21150 [Synergistales bacterium]